MATREKLESLLGQDTAKRGEFTLNDLFDEVHPNSREELALALGQLVNKGKIKQIIRVVSPGGGGIKDFGDFSEVPDVIPDWRTGKELEVSPGDLQVIYMLPR